MDRTCGWKLEFDFDRSFARCNSDLWSCGMAEEEKTMRKKSILKIGISLLVFCILLGAYFFLKQLNKEESEEETTSEEVFSASSDEIEKISFDLEGEKVTF